MFYVLVIPFFILSWLAITATFYLSCYLKKKLNPEGIPFRVMMHLMCQACKEACVSHKKIILRALMFAALGTAIFTLGYYFPVLLAYFR